MTYLHRGCGDFPPEGSAADFVLLLKARILLENLGFTRFEPLEDHPRHE